MIFRLKGIADDALSIDEAIKKIEGAIAYLKALKEQGYELEQPVTYDFCFLDQTTKPKPKENRDD